MRLFALTAILLTVAFLLAEPLAAAEISQANLYQAASCEEVARAGWPWCHWVWAQPQNRCDYTGYYVGGGAPGPRSREHCPGEGTWGWDYRGKKLPRLVRLGWTYPPRRQGGEGAYQPDGPRIIEAVHEHLHAGHEAD
jgi:hypothetical protein